MAKARIIGVIAAALMLTGCGAQTDAPTNDAAPVESSAPVETSAPEPDVTPEPLVAETTAPALDEADEMFLTYLRDELAKLPTTGIGSADDAQLTAAGHNACTQLLAGADSESIRLIDGEQPTTTGYYMDTATIIDSARRHYCPETLG